MSKACRVCHHIVEKTANICPSCKTHDLSSVFTVEIFFLIPEDSEVSQRM